MSKRIIAIGGGECGRITKNGNKMPYETKKIDEEIIKLTNKENPNFLFVGHAQSNVQNENKYFETMSAVYGETFGCKCKVIRKADLLSQNTKLMNTLLHWADIIYVGGGDTKGMMELWRSTGFDKLLKEAYESGKVMCGLSAGANCWFNICSSDSLKIQTNNNNAPMITVDCLNLINAFFTPHCDEADNYSNRLEHMKEALRDKSIIGIGISNCCALEIIDNNYRLICCDASNYGIDAFGVKAYYKNNEYYVEKIENSLEFKPLKNLLTT